MFSKEPSSTETTEVRNHQNSKSVFAGEVPSVRVFLYFLNIKISIFLAHVSPF